MATKVFRLDPAMYNIDLDGEEILDKFYKDELSPVDKKDDTYKVDKVLIRRKGLALVKWLGYDDKFNSWIPKTKT